MSQYLYQRRQVVCEGAYELLRQFMIELVEKECWALLVEYATMRETEEWDDMSEEEKLKCLKNDGCEFSPFTSPVGQSGSLKAGQQ